MLSSSGRSGLPLYRVICLVLREGIESGRYRPGIALPTEGELARDYGVSRITVRRALGELASAGLIERRQGSGTFVRSRPDGAGRPLGAIPSAINQLETIARYGTARIVEFGYVETPPEIAAVFGRYSCERMQRAVRLREADGEAMLHITTWIPEVLGRAYDSADMERETVGRLLARSGVKTVSGEQTVSVTLAEPALARLMRLDVGAPLLKVVRLLRDQRRRPVEYAELLARADRFHIRMKLGG